MKTLGGEARRLQERGARLAGPEIDPALEEFELKEAARQQIEQLDMLEQRAKLSPQQAEVWRRLRRGMEIEEVAAELGIPKTQVSVAKNKAIQKLQKAAGF